MSIYSAKHRIVTATILVAGLQCGLVVPSIAAEAPVTTHSAMQKTGTLNATPGQGEGNQEVQGAASAITMRSSRTAATFYVGRASPKIWRPPMFWWT